MPDKILVTIVSYKCYAFVKLAVDSIIKNTDEPYDLLIINNDPNDSLTSDYFKRLTEDHSNVYVINMPSNLGIAVAWNRVIDFAFKNPDYKWVSLFHSDIVLNKGWASKVKQALNDYPEFIGMSSVEINTTETEYLTLPVLTNTRIFYNTFDGQYLWNHEGLLNQLNQIYQGNFEDKASEYESKLKGLVVNGAGFSAVTFRKEVFEKVGYFDEVFKCGMEDLDFHERMIKLGLRTAKTGNAFSHHWMSVTFIQSRYIDGKQEANIGKDIFTKNITRTTPKDCLKITCKFNNDGICHKGYKQYLMPTVPCPEYEYDGTHVEAIKHDPLNALGTQN